MMPELDPEHVEWTLHALRMLKLGGEWHIPRSNVCVRRISENTVEIIGPIKDEPELVAHIEAAGFTVTAIKEADDAQGNVSREDYLY